MFFMSALVKADTANRMSKKRPCILGAHQKTSLGLQDKGQFQQQRNLTCSLLHPASISGWDIRGSWKMKQLFCTARVFSLPKAHAMNILLSSSLWGFLVPGQGIKERKQRSLKQ